MSPPDTNIERQEKRHRPALIGIAIAVIMGGLFFFLNALTAVDEEPLEELPAGEEQAPTGQTPADDADPAPAGTEQAPAETE